MGYIPDEKEARTIKKYPLAVLVFIVTALLSTFINRSFNTDDGRKDDCMEQVAYLRERVEKLEQTQEEYTRAVLFKDAQIKNRESVIDSLKRETVK